MLSPTSCEARISSAYYVTAIRPIVELGVTRKWVHEGPNVRGRKSNVGEVTMRE